MDWVTIVVATYGENGWDEIAERCAVPSALKQGVDVISVHLPTGTLAEARNEALRRVRTEFVIFLDGDDELEPGYVDAMATGTADLRAPALTQYYRGSLFTEPFMPKVFMHRHDCEPDCLRVGNWLVIGTCARAQLLRDVGGWEEWPWSEDWQLWAKAWKAGASVEAIPDAVYKAHIASNGRNRQYSTFQIRQIHRDIEMSVWGDLVDPQQHPERIGR